MCIQNTTPATEKNENFRWWTVRPSLFTRPVIVFAIRQTASDSFTVGSKQLTTCGGFFYQKYAPESGELFAETSHALSMLIDLHWYFKHRIEVFLIFVFCAHWILIKSPHSSSKINNTASGVPATASQYSIVPNDNVTPLPWPLPKILFLVSSLEKIISNSIIIRYYAVHLRIVTPSSLVVYY